MSQNEPKDVALEAVAETELNEAELESVAGGSDLIGWVKDKIDYAHAVIDYVIDPD